MTPKITKWIVPISGFTQSKERTNGIDNLWLKVRDHANGTVSVLPPQVWNADWKAVARWMWSMSSQDARPTIYVFAYSWGCGHGFDQLSKHLGSYGFDIDVAVLSDPVYRSRWRPWRSMLPRRWTPAITIRENVKTVHSFHQEVNRPQGAELIATNIETTRINAPVRLHYSHQAMDDVLEFHSKCLSVLE